MNIECRLSCIIISFLIIGCFFAALAIVYYSPAVSSPGEDDDSTDSSISSGTIYLLISFVAFVAAVFTGIYRGLLIYFKNRDRAERRRLGQELSGSSQTSTEDDGHMEPRRIYTRRPNVDPLGRAGSYGTLQSLYSY